MRFHSVSLPLTFLGVIFSISILEGQVPELVLPIGHSGMVRDANYSPDGKRISTTSEDRTVKIWNADNGRLLLTLDGFNSFEIVSTVTFSPDGKTIMTINEVGNISIWDSKSGKLIFNPDNSAWKRNINASTDINEVKFSPDGKYLFLIQDTVLNMWDVRNGKLNRTIHGHKGGIQSFNFSPDGKIIILYSGDGSADILTAKNGDLICTFNKKSGTSDFSDASFSPDDRKVMIYSGEGLEIWDPANCNLLTTIATASDSKPCFSPDGRKILAVGNLLFRNGKWKKASEVSFSFSVDSGGVSGPGAGLYDSENGKLLRTFVDPATIDAENETIGNNVPIYKVGFSPDGKTVVIVSDKCRIWDAEKGKLLYTIEGKFDDYSSLYFTPDGKRILIITYYSTELYDATTGSLLHSYDAPHFRIYNTPDDKRYIVPVAKLSPDGKSFYIVSGSFNSLKTWDSQTGELKLDLTGNSSPVSEAVFNPEGKSILSKSYTNGSTARIWDLQSGKIIKSFEGQEWRNAVYCNGGMNIRTSYSNEAGRSFINMWDATSGEKLGNIELKSDSLIKLSFSPDGRNVVVIDTNYNAKILDTGTGSVLHDLTGPIADVKYSPDSKIIATTSWFDYIDIWDIESGRLQYRLRSRENPGVGDTLKFEMEMIDTLGNLAPVRTVVTPEMSFRELSDFAKKMATSSIKIVEFSSDGNTLIETGNRDNVTRMWNIQNGTFSNSIEGNKAALSPDGTKILTFDDLGDNETGPVVRDLKSNKKLFGLEPDRLQIGSARFSPDGKTIITSDNDSLKIWDAQNGKLKQAVYFSGFFYDVDWNGAKLMIHDNSKLLFFDMATGKKLYTLIAIDSLDYLVVTPDNYYMGTKNATSKLSWRVGNQLYSFDQFDLQYNRPDIVLERLGNPDTALIMMYRNAYEKRLKRSGFNDEMFSSQWHTPEIEIPDSDSLIFSPDKSQLQLKVCGTDDRYKLDRLLVWVNGVPVYGANGISLLKEKSDSIVKKINIRLSAGENNIKVSCMNEKGVESLRESVEVVYNPQQPVKPDLYIIAMSVSHYKDKNFNLQYAAKDGKDIVNMLDSLALSENDFGKIYVDALFDKKATRGNFFNLRKRLLATNIDDKVVMYISGHGLLDENMDFYFATYDMDFRHPEKKGISFDNLESILDSIPSRRKLLMMDACHSGEVDKEEINNVIASNTEISPDVTFRGTVREYDIKSAGKRTIQSGVSLSNSFELMQELFTGLDQGTGATVISAAAGKGYALESPQWNNGVFTYTIINGLKNKAADKNGDGIITISELRDYSIKQVPLLTGGRQKPTVRREPTESDWNIF
jgi:WD40 repeat protein